MMKSRLAPTLQLGGCDFGADIDRATELEVAGSTPASSTISQRAEVWYDFVDGVYSSMRWLPVSTSSTRLSLSATIRAGPQRRESTLRRIRTIASLAEDLGINLPGLGVILKG
jgi:hypothetical protein